MRPSLRLELVGIAFPRLRDRTPNICRNSIQALRVHRDRKRKHRDVLHAQFRPPDLLSISATCDRRMVAKWKIRIAGYHQRHPILFGCCSENPYAGILTFYRDNCRKIRAGEQDRGHFSALHCPRLSAGHARALCHGRGGFRSFFCLTKNARSLHPRAAVSFRIFAFRCGNTIPISAVIIRHRPIRAACHQCPGAKRNRRGPIRLAFEQQSLLDSVPIPHAHGPILRGAEVIVPSSLHTIRRMGCSCANFAIASGFVVSFASAEMFQMRIRLSAPAPASLVPSALHATAVAPSQAGSKYPCAHRSSHSKASPSDPRSRWRAIFHPAETPRQTPRHCARLRSSVHCHRQCAIA